MAKKQALPSGNVLLPHPLADTVPGEMSEEEFTALCTSVKQHGIRNPIITYEGQILDGRSRHKASTKMDVPFKVEEFKGTEAEAIEFVIDNNLHRRTLTSMQKAIVAARMCKRETKPLSQKDSAAMVGCSLQSVNLAVRLLSKNNTPLIKRAERGDATRGEIEELLYDSGDIQQASRQERVPVTTDGTPGEQVDGEDEELEEMLGDTDGHSSKPKATVTDISTRLPAVGTKPSRAGKVATETPASRVVQSFKALKEAERRHFVDMAWTWLEPAIKLAGRSVMVEAKTDPKKAEAAKAKHRKEDKAAAKAAEVAKAEATKAKKGKKRKAA